MLELLLFECFECKGTSTACPQCVNTIRIDPETMLPPDVVIENETYVHNPNPDPEAVARSVKVPICDNCIEDQNEERPDRQVMTSEERHKRGYCENA